MPDDVTKLFPALAQQLENWDGRAPASDGHDDPSHAGVTDDDMEAYLRSVGSLRAPLGPAVSGQNVPNTPEFYNNGRAVPAGGNSYMEGADTSVPEYKRPASAQPAGDGGADADVDEGEGSVEPPETTPPPPPPDHYEIAGRKYDRAQAEAWAQFDQMVAADPQLRQTIADYLQKRTQPQAPQTPAQPPTTPSLELPALPPEYEGDETIQRLYQAVQTQQDAIARLSKQASNAESLAQHQVQRTYADIAQGAITEFQKSRQLDDTTMAAVSRAARASGFAEKYMAGIDPLTGTSVAPDPYKAVTAALEAGYLMAPETRQIDIDREIEARAARLTAERTRKEKLGGVSGAGGSVPRTQSVPTNPQDSKAALLQEVTQMMNGSWAGDGS